MKLYKTKADDELYYYFLKSGAQRWMYRHKYYDVLGKRKEKKKSGFKSEEAALKELLGIKAALLSGQARHIEHDQMTVAQWLDIWYETNVREWEKTTIRQRNSVINNYIKPLLGKFKLSKLDKSTYIREFINKLPDYDLENSTISLYHDIFKIAINAAVEDEIIPRNRFTKISIETEKRLENFLSPNELNIFLDSAKKYCNITSYTMVLLLAYSGLRKGEAHGLTWGNINFKDKTITVERTRDKNGSRPPKTKNSYRTIKVDNEVITQLKLYQKWCIEKKLNNGVQLDKENDYVFISYKNGEPINDYYVNDFFHLLYNKMENDNIHLKKITPHGLRHTHATILISIKIQPKTVADRLGNTVKVLYDTYTHSFEELEELSVQAFNESLLKWG